MAKRLVIYNAPPVPYSQAAFPALKFYLPFTETSGGSFSDIAGGLVWTPVASGSADIADLHSVSGAATVTSHDNTTDAALSRTFSSDLPAPGTKVSVLLAVFGTLPVGDSGSGNFAYLRFGETNGTSINDFVISMNTKSDVGNNCLKNNPPGTTGPSVTWTPIAGVSTHAVVSEWIAPSTMKSHYYVNGNVYNGTDITADSPITRLRPMLSLAVTPNGVTSPVFSLHTLQFWHFDALPTEDDMKAACLWTRDKALAGIKAPYPGWANRT